MQPTNPQIPSPTPKPQNFLSRALFGGWLAKALTVITLISFITVSGAFLADIYYQKALTKLKSTTPKQAFSQFSNQASPTPTTPLTENLEPSIEPTSSPTLEPTKPGQTSTPTRRITNSPSPTRTQTANTSTPNPTNPPQATNTQPPTSSPTPQPAIACYVLVAGYLYNMSSAIGTTVTDQNTGKTRSHVAEIDISCGTQDNPVDMTDTYLDKHQPMGCWQRLAPYIVTPPAPTDPTC